MGLFTKSKKQEKATSPPQSPPQFASQSTADALQYAPPLPQRPVTSGGQQYGPFPPSAWPVAAPTYLLPPFQPCQQVFVSNYLVTAPQPPKYPSKGKKEKRPKPKISSPPAIKLPQLGLDVPSCVPGARIFNDGISQWHVQGTQYLNQGAALYELISSKFNSVVTSIDGEKFSGEEQELWIHQPPTTADQQLQVVSRERGVLKDVTKPKSQEIPKDGTGCPIATKFVSTNYFTKVNLYANSRLPSNLPAVKLYIPAFPLLCIAAQYSERVYTKPTGKEKETFVDADWRIGTKSMVIKSVPMDDKNVIIFAIRGSQTFMDWAVNLNSAPATPAGFLDDPGNFCHAGFLSVARKMVGPVAARLRNLLTEDPTRSESSLLITGHSAGGAVAALLYSHMLASSPETESELNTLTGCFKRIHCVTFGAPPVSLLPLGKPDSNELKKSIFFSFVNEGDPVARADKAYVKSLIDLYASPAPRSTSLSPAKPRAQKSRPTLDGNKPANSSSLTVYKPRSSGPSRAHSATDVAPTWPVPPSTLSNAGRLILLRGLPKSGSKTSSSKKKGGTSAFDERMDDRVQAKIVTDEQLRGVIWGDPVCHMMRLYAKRIEILAINAVVGGGWGGGG